MNVARVFNVAGSEVILLEDGTPAVRTVLNWVVGARFVGSALNEDFVTFTATVTDANGNWASPRVRSSSPTLRPTANS